uniref:Uncharacterized protein n=1 Tax=Ananas comosus var. bracteatus TaxID=296719 RepID=A0A6V7NX33_ANACO|nr:unnamed protein product [Ananas comosus var. bracteatus]
MYTCLPSQWVPQADEGEGHSPVKENKKRVISGKGKEDVTERAPLYRLRVEVPTCTYVAPVSQLRRSINRTYEWSTELESNPRILTTNLKIPTCKPTGIGFPNRLP